ncbi:MAG: GHKL domain-containing protein [Oscillospiraceae bacterium]|nr:GHKL domain-containing protein [Oscillospiraceae bacterium]
MIDILSFVLEFAASFAEAFILYDIFQILFSPQKGIKKTKMTWIIILIAVGLVQGLNAIALFSLFTILFLVLYWSISAKFLYGIDYITTLSITSFYTLIVVVFDFFIFTAFGTFSGGYDTFSTLVSNTGIERMIVVLSTKLLWVLCYLLIRKYLVKFHFNKDSRTFFIRVTIAGCIVCLILAKMTFDTFPYAINQLWFLSVCAIICFAFYHGYTVKKKMKDAELEMIELRNQMLEDSYETLNVVYAKNAKLHHDINNHLDTLYQLLDTNAVSEAKEYIERISEPVKDLNRVVWTGVDVVDAILNSKLEKAKKDDIEMTYNVEYPKHSNIQAHDICVILSNLIDNALEAVMKGQGKKEVKVTIRKINSFLTIQVSNDIFEPVKMQDGKIITTKSDTLLHGWGIQSVKAAAENYEGTVKYTYDNQQFVVTVILFY